MLMHIPMIVLTSQLVLTVADQPPKFDIARGCKVDSASAFDPNAGMNATPPSYVELLTCVQDAQLARKLPKN
jgi:hypothetical protein